MLERFDRNRDGRLEPEERHRAIEALRRLVRRMELREQRDELRREGREGHEARGRYNDRRNDLPARRDRSGRSMIERFDRNGDGVIGLDELPPEMARRLQRLDRNGDGVIGPDEIPSELARKLRRLDRNGDGWLDERDQP